MSDVSDLLTTDRKTIIFTNEMSLGQKTRYCAMSKLRRKCISVVCLLLISLFIFLDNYYFKHNLLPGRVSATQTANSDFDKYHSKNFSVVNVVDGDTLDIYYPDNQNKFTRVRLLGIDAPEVRSESGPAYYGSQASDFVKDSVLGRNVTLYLDNRNNYRGKYGRLLAYIMLPDGKFLNEIMLSEGFAYADTRFRHSFYNKYKQLETSASSNKKGLWQNITPEQMPEWMNKNESN
jgi:endonuclease YncB( thermonuclease family)